MAAQNRTVIGRVLKSKRHLDCFCCDHADAHYYSNKERPLRLPLKLKSDKHKCIRSWFSSLVELERKAMSKIKESSSCSSGQKFDVAV